MDHKKTTVKSPLHKRLFYSIFKKKSKHEPETQKQKTQKLLRFTRGNTPLTVAQQQELFYLNEENLRKIKQGLREMRALEQQKLNQGNNEHLQFGKTN